MKNPYLIPMTLALLASGFGACSSNSDSSDQPTTQSDSGSEAAVQEAAAQDTSIEQDAAPAEASVPEDSPADEGAAEVAAEAEPGKDGGQDVVNESSPEADAAKPVCGTYQAVADWPTSGYLLHFTAAGEHAHVLVTSNAAITHVSQWLQSPSESLGIPGGPIELSSQYNPGYSYRLVPDQVNFGDMWIELCDAAPCYIEQDPSAWLDNPKTWCPWGFTVVEVWDCQGNTSGDPCPSVYP